MCVDCGVTALADGDRVPRNGDDEGVDRERLTHDDEARRGAEGNRLGLPLEPECELPLYFCVGGYRQSPPSCALSLVDCR